MIIILVEIIFSYLLLVWIVARFAVPYYFGERNEWIDVDPWSHFLGVPIGKKSAFVG